MKRNVTTFLLFLVACWVQAQIQEPITFKQEMKSISDTEAELIFSATIEPGWHVYSTELGDGGPISASFHIEQIAGAALDGKLKAVGNEISAFDPLFDMKVRYFEKSAQFVQRVKLTGGAYHLQDPGNMGTIIRTAEGAGATGVIISSDSVDIYNPKVIRSTMGSVFRVPIYVSNDLKKDIDRIRGKDITVYAAHLNGRQFYDNDYTKGSAFLIGNEGNGLRKETADAADIYVRIPMCGKVESLNAAIASSVLMFEAARQRRE